MRSFGDGGLAVYFIHEHCVAIVLDVVSAVGVRVGGCSTDLRVRAANGCDFTGCVVLDRQFGCPGYVGLWPMLRFFDEQEVPRLRRTAN
jgi:hypothetical protein